MWCGNMFPKWRRSVGQAMAQKARTLGMHVALSDIGEGPLQAAVERLRGETPGFFVCVCNV